MTEPDFGFFFERQGKGSTTGLNSGAGEHFEGKDLEAAVVREMGQNTGDNPADRDKPVKLVFELRSFTPESFPGVSELRRHIKSTERATEGQEGHTRLIRALELLKSDEISTLVVSDYNTTGLKGSENDDDSGLSRLTRMSGRSPSGEQGGSFGLGSSVALQVSELSTVYYRSLTSSSDLTVFTGRSSLASHDDDDGHKVVGEGFFCDRNSDAFVYQRPAPAIEGLSPRVEAGTDIIIPGYRFAESDPELEQLRRFAVENFLVAIKERLMVIVGIGRDGEWRLDHETIEAEAQRMPKTAAFLEAYLDPAPVTRVLDGLGEVRLHVAFSDAFEKKYHTMCIRKPRMLITTKRHNRISKPYAAVLVVDSGAGNAYLRKLENPAHNEWDFNRADRRGESKVEARKRLTALWDFVYEVLRERAAELLDDEVDIAGLGLFLPSGDEGLGNRATTELSDESGDGEEESGTGSGVEDDEVEVEEEVIEPVDRAGDATPDPSGGDGEGPGKDGSGESGDSGDRQPVKPGGTGATVSSDVEMRAWVGTNSQKEEVTIIILKSEGGYRGDLELVPVGRVRAEDRDLSVRSVVNADGKKLSFDGNVLKGISLRKGEDLRLEIDMPRRRRLEIRVPKPVDPVRPESDKS